jgi:hypothetical protein
MDDESKPMICVDLDGFLNEFQGRKGPNLFHSPRPGAREFLEQLNACGYRVVLYTARWSPHVESWLARYGLSELVWMVTDKRSEVEAHGAVEEFPLDAVFEWALEQLGLFETQWGPA